MATIITSVSVRQGLNLECDDAEVVLMGERDTERKKRSETANRKTINKLDTENVWKKTTKSRHTFLCLCIKATNHDGDTHNTKATREIKNATVEIFEQ